MLRGAAFSAVRSVAVQLASRAGPASQHRRK
jgi:hypothetical protein